MIITILACIGAITVLRMVVKSIRWWRENRRSPGYFSRNEWLR